MVKIIPNNNLAKVEEVREIENKDLGQKPIAESVKEAVKEAALPVAYASDKDLDEDEKESLKKFLIGGNAAATGILTAICPPAGVAVGAAQAATGAVLKQSNDEDKKVGGEILSDAAAIGGGIGVVASAGEVVTEGVKGVGEVANQVVETIKKL